MLIIEMLILHNGFLFVAIVHHCMITGTVVRKALPIHRPGPTV